MQAILRATEYYLPPQVLTNEQLAAGSDRWTAEDIEAKTGIAVRHIAGEEVCSSDLAVLAAEKLFTSGVCKPADIDYLLLCTQSPDYFLPTTACLLQERLGLSTSVGAMDFNLGCSGFVYGLGLAKGLIQTEQARNVLLLTAETYSKFINDDDMNVRALFGDGAAATLVQAAGEDTAESFPTLGPFVYGTDGRGGHNLIVNGGAAREGLRRTTSKDRNTDQPQSRLFMDGPEIFSFTLQSVPKAVDALLAKCDLARDDVHLFVLHQANEYMLECLRKKMKIPSDKFLISMRDCGNTVSCTIPIALKRAELDGQYHAGDKVVLVGFGVGYSWAATLLS